MDITQHNSTNGDARARAISVGALTLDLPSLARGLGYRLPRADDAAASAPQDRELPPHMAEIAQAMLDLGRELIEPHWVWKQVAITVKREGESLVCEPSAVELAVGRLVRAQVSRA